MTVILVNQPICAELNEKMKGLVLANKAGAE